MRKVLHSKIHRATVTHANVDYEGSITIPPDLLAAAKMHEFEAVAVWNVTTGTRFETYTILGEPGSRDIAVNGAAAHLVTPGDLVIIACFSFHTEERLAEGYEPTVVFVDQHNRIREKGREIPGPRLRLVPPEL